MDSSFDFEKAILAIALVSCGLLALARLLDRMPPPAI